MGMTYEDIKKKIGRRVADPDLYTYSNEVEDYFAQAMATLIKKTPENSNIPYYLEEITPLLNDTSKSITPGTYHYAEIKIDKNNFTNLLKIYDIDTVTSSNKIFTYVNDNNFDLIVKNSEVVPVSNQGYWTISGNYLKVYLDKSTEVRIKYINNPNPSSWGSINDDFITDYGYGYGFIIDCIELASSLLKRQIGIEG